MLWAHGCAGAARRCALFVAAFACAGLASAGVAHDPALHWQTLHTDHFAIHFHDGGEATARRAAAIAERAHERITARFHWTPADRTDIVISDEADVPNGNASPLPANRSNLFTAPPDAIDSLETNDGWLESLIQHELTHIVHLDKARGYPHALRSVLGRIFNPFPFLNAFPNSTQPVWMIEGLAVNSETDRERRTGRGQSSYFDMLMRMEVAGNFKPVRQANWVIDTWPGGTTPYLYGAEYYNFITATRGPTAAESLVDVFSNDFVPYMVNTASKGVFKKNLKRMWDEFAAWERTKHEPMLEAIRASGVNEGERLSSKGYAAGSLDALADGRVFYVAFDGRSEPALMTYRDGSKVAKLANLQSGARLDAHATAGILVAQREVCRNARDYYDLYRYDSKTGRRDRLTHCARYRHAAWSPDGQRIAAVHHEMGRSRLELLNARSAREETLWQAPLDEVIGELDWSPDGASIAAAVWRRESGWNLELFSLESRTWRALTNDSAIDAEPRFAADGRSILFTSDHGGVYNVRRLDLATGAIATLSNVLGGAFYPAQSQSDIFYIGYGSSGFDLFRLRAPAATPTPSASPGPSVSVESDPPAVEGARITRYDPDTGLRPRWWMPVIAVDTDQAEVGASTAGADPLNRHLYAISAAYDFENQMPVGSFQYVYDGWYPIVKLHAERDNTFTRTDDEDAELLRLRQEDTYQLEVIFPLLKYRRDITLRAAALQENESDEFRAPGVQPLPDTRDGVVGAAITYDSTRRYPLSVSRSNGRDIRLVGESSDVLDSDFTGQVYTLDWREFVALGREHVLAARWVEGHGTDTPRPFELGGSDPDEEGVNLLGDTLSGSPFNRREFALRGYPEGLPELRNRRMRLASLEYRFPLWRLERGSMVPFPIALHQLHGTLFGDTGKVWADHESESDYHTGAGIEINADVGLLYAGRLAVRFGYAHGFDVGGDDEFYAQVGVGF